MTEPDEIRQRLGSLEQRVDVLEEGQAGSRRAAELFTVVDRDVADVKEAFSAQRHVLQALRDTQLEQGRVLVEHGRAIGAIVVTLQAMQQSQQAMQHSQQAMQHSMESMQHSQQAMQQSMESMQQTQDTMRADLRTLQTGMRSVKETVASHGLILARLDPGQNAG